MRMHLDQWLAVFVAGAISGSVVIYADPFSTSNNPMGGPGGDMPPPMDFGNTGILGTASKPNQEATAETPTPGATTGDGSTTDNPADPGAQTPHNGGRNQAGSKGGDSAPRLTKHLMAAPGLWRELADKARASGNPRQVRLANDIAKQAESVPSMTDRLPPLSDMTAYMVSSQSMITEMKAAGMDCGVLEVQVSDLTKPRGQPR